MTKNVETLSYDLVLSGPRFLGHLPHYLYWYTRTSAVTIAVLLACVHRLQNRRSPHQPHQPPVRYAWFMYHVLDEVSMYHGGLLARRWAFATAAVCAWTCVVLCAEHLTTITSSSTSTSTPPTIRASSCGNITATTILGIIALCIFDSVKGAIPMAQLVTWLTPLRQALFILLCATQLVKWGKLVNYASVLQQWKRTRAWLATRVAAMITRLGIQKDGQHVQGMIDMEIELPMYRAKGCAAQGFKRRQMLF